jgi:exopolyphosphatase/guanosine-5'-triphosphate,3'-diphosphate pyrophosphatase
MRVAALDLGSNTSLLLVADVENGAIEKVVHDETTITKMGQGVHANRKLHPEALERLEECFARYRKTIVDLKCGVVLAVATSAARDVSNGHLLIELGQKYDIPIHIISGDKEAALTFKGAICDRPGEAGDGIAVIDVGGGSTEVITGIRGNAVGQSVDVGSVRLTELFIKHHPVSKTEREAVEKYAREAFAKAVLSDQPIREVIAVAGTPTTLAAVDQQVEFSEEKVNGYKLSLNTIDSWTTKMAAMTVEEREELPGMQPKRADVIVAGAIILASAMRRLARQEVTVSTRGVRYGVALAWQEF